MMQGIQVVFTIDPPKPQNGLPVDGTPFELLHPSPGDPSWLTPAELVDYIERCQTALNQWRSLQGGGALRGHELAERAYRILDARGTMHYKELYAAIVAPGRVVGGAEPEATLLAAISRDDRIVSARSRSGLYKVSVKGK